MQFIPEFENLITSFFKPLRDEIKQSLRWGHGISFDSGALAERINFVLNDTSGTASNGGGAFDAINGSEVKSVFYAQPSKCRNCGAKVHYYATKCKCGSSDLKPIKDTRWGIDTEAHFKYLEKIPYYFFVIITPLNKDIDELKFNIDIYKVDANDPIFNTILRKQRDSGAKPNKNLLPFSRDFYMSSPTQVLSVNVTVGENVSYDYVSRVPTQLTTISTTLFTKAERELLDNAPVVDVDTAFQVLGQRKTSHGKARGETKRKIK